MNIDVCSHTLVRNGMPFIDLVLRQAEPFMNKMIITVSENSTDGTIGVVNDFERQFKHKVRILWENVEDPTKLTLERQRQVAQTNEDWILFLDDDDFWPEESLKEMMGLIKEDVDAYAVSPVQVIDQFKYDKHWYEKKYFTKWFRNKNIIYHDPWPRDTIWSGDKELYWKKNKGTIRLTGKYFHLSNIKSGSFRNEKWTKGHYEEPIKNYSDYPDWCKPHLEKIYERVFRPNK